MISTEQASAAEGQAVAQQKQDGERLTWNILAQVHKFTAAQEAEAIEICARDNRTDLGNVLKEFFTPYEIVESEGNLLTRLGRKRLIDRFVETASNVGIKVTTGRIGTGNSSTAAADTDTDLIAAAGSANRQFQMLDSAPTVGTGASSGVMTGVSTFGTGVGNYAWNEWGIDGGTAAGTTVTSDTNTTPGLINRKVVSLGTKTSAASWVFTVTITIT